MPVTSRGRSGPARSLYARGGPCRLVADGVEHGHLAPAHPRPGSARRFPLATASATASTIAAYWSRPSKTSSSGRVVRAKLGPRDVGREIGVDDLDQPTRADQLVRAAQRLFEAAIDQPEDPAGEVERGRQREVDARRPEPRQGADRVGLAPGEEPRGAHAVTADVPERPAAPPRVEPPVAGLDRERERGSDEAKVADRPARPPGVGARRSGAGAAT